MIASFGVPFALLNSLAVIEGADQLLTASPVAASQRLGNLAALG